jgi:uncharacterized membrane protein
VKAMPLIVFCMLYLITMWGVFALSYNAGQRWPIIGKIVQESEGSFLLCIAAWALLAILLGVIGIEIK